MNRECECCPAMEGCNIAIQPGSAMCTIRKMQGGKTKGNESKECGIDKKTTGHQIKAEKMDRYTIILPKSKFKRIRIAEVEREVKIKTIFEEMLDEYLARHNL